MSFHPAILLIRTLVSGCFELLISPIAAREFLSQPFLLLSRLTISMKPCQSRASTSVVQKGEAWKMMKPRNSWPIPPHPKSKNDRQKLGGARAAPGTVCKSEFKKNKPMQFSMQTKPLHRWLVLSQGLLFLRKAGIHGWPRIFLTPAQPGFEKNSLIGGLGPVESGQGSVETTLVWSKFTKTCPTRSDIHFAFRENSSKTVWQTAPDETGLVCPLPKSHPVIGRNVAVACASPRT